VREKYNLKLSSLINEQRRSSNVTEEAERVEGSFYSDEGAETAEEYFYVDGYSEEQIREIIGIFKNDFKPPKNLWIEKAGGTMARGSEADNLVEHVGFQDS